MRGKVVLEEESEGYLASVSDLMAGLLFVFIVALFAFALQLTTATGEAERERAVAEERRIAREAELNSVRRTAEALEARRTQVEADLEAMRGSARAEVAALRAEVSEGLGAEVRHLDEALGRARARRAALLSSLQGVLERRGVPVTLDADTGVLRLSDRILFASGRSDLPPGGPAREAVRALADGLAAILPCYAAGAEARTDCDGLGTPVIDAVFVEGHTDRRRLGTGERDGNYELSANRALNTYAALQAARPELWESRNAAGLPLMGVSGYGPDRPVPGRISDREEDLAANRRIEIRFLLAAPRSPDLDVLRERLRQFTNGAFGESGRR